MHLSNEIEDLLEQLERSIDSSLDAYNTETDPNHKIYLYDVYMSLKDLRDGLRDFFFI